MRIKLLLILTTILFSSVQVRAEDGSVTQPGESSKNTEITLRQDNSDAKKHRPKSPSKQNIVCGYDGSEFYLTFVLPEGQCTLTVTDSDGHSEYAEFDSEELDIRIHNGDMHGNIHVSLDTELGNRYIGNLSTTED